MSFSPGGAHVFRRKRYAVGVAQICDFRQHQTKPKATLENAQRLQSQQAEVLKQAIEDNTRSARQLSEAHSLADVMAVQVKLAGAQAERAADFWTRAWRTASETQVAVLGQVQNQVGQFSERVREVGIAGSARGRERRVERRRRAARSGAQGVTAGAAQDGLAGPPALRPAQLAVTGSRAARQPSMPGPRFTTRVKPACERMCTASGPRVVPLPQ